MNRFDLASAAGLFIFAFGLASCSPDRAIKDSYKAPPPVIVTGKGQQGFLQWERSSDKTLDLQDAFDVSAGNPARTEVLAHCMRDKTSFTEKFSVDGRQSIKIFQVVPQDVLFENLENSGVTCDWEVSLYNEIGSRHVIRLPGSPLSDLGEGGVLVESSGGGESLKLVQILRTQGVKVRYRNSATASAEILCRDVNFEPLPFERVLDLSQFNWRHPLYRQGRGEADVTRNPLQSCRVAISEGGRLKQISRRLTLHIPRAPLEIHVAATFNPRPFTQIEHFLHPASAAEISIRNTTGTDRFIQVPRTVPARYDFFLMERARPGVKRVKNLALDYIHIQALDAVQVSKEEAAGRTILIPAQATLNLRVIFQVTSSPCPKLISNVVGFSARLSPLLLNEVMPSGETLETVDVEMADFQWVKINEPNFQEIPAAFCF
jgi:hypothetical protein